MIVHAIQNADTGEFYSESQFLEDEARQAGKKWKNTSILPLHAKRYANRKDAVRRSRELSKQTGCVFSLFPISTEVPKC